MVVCPFMACHPLDDIVVRDNNKAAAVLLFSLCGRQLDESSASVFYDFILITQHLKGRIWSGTTTG